MRAPLSASARRLAAGLVLLAAAVPASAGAQRVRHSAARVAPATPDTVITLDAPASAALAQWVGVYRLMLADRGGARLDTRVLVERYGDRLAGVLLVDQQASGLSDVRVEHDDVLSMAVRTADGNGRMVLRRTADGVAGTLTIGRKVWNLAGARSI